MAYIQGQPPYYDYFDPDDNYTSILFKPGAILQNRELNELQSTYKYRLKQIADAFLTNGDIIEGCQLIIPEGIGARECMITAGKIYLNGSMHTVTETKIMISGVGEEQIGIKIIEKPITPQIDAGLVDPAAGFPNYQDLGADRLQESVLFTLNDEEASTLWYLNDGSVINLSSADDTTVLDKFGATLARRTYDESGNYKVWGLEISAKPILNNDENLYISVAEGKAYVQGWERLKQSATTLALPRANELRATNSEPKAFTTGVDKYPLNNSPVNEISRATATVSVTMQLTRGSVANGTDPIPEIYRPLVDIQNIVQVGTGKIYVKGLDYSVFGDTVSWALGGDEPASGESYTITFTYNKTMTQELDYDLLFEGEQYYLRLLKDYDNPQLDENGSTVNGIVSGSAMLIDYTFMLYYIAVITLDSAGKFRIVQGDSDIKERVARPDLNDMSVLMLGSVLLTPKSDALEIKNETTTRLEFWELQALAKRLYDVEYNQAVTDLDNEAMAGEDPTLLKGIYTDGFLGFTKCDLHYDNTSLGIKFDCGIDMDNRELTTAADVNAHFVEVQNRQDLFPVSSCTAYKRLVTAKATEYLEIKQPYATKVMKVNPYLAYPERPAMSIYPETDSWVDTSNVTITDNQVVNVSGGTVLSYRTVYGSWSGTSTAQSSTTTSTVTTSNTTKVLESAISYMRQIDIEISGKKFGAHRDNIYAKFNDIIVALVASNSDFQGTKTGSLKSNVYGEVKGKLTVPKNVLCGTVDIVMYPEDDPDFIAAATFTANGTKRVIQNIITNTTVNTTTVFKTITSYMVRNVDPLAQTFRFEDSRMITSVGLYFAEVDPNHDVIVQLRGAELGMPNGVGYAEKVLKASECISSEKGEIETRVVFDDPIYLEGGEEYSIVILTESAETSLYYAEIGGRDLLTNAQIVKNPYLEGVMLSSSNASVWTAHQTSDLKFNVYSCKYDETSYLYLGELSSLRYSGIMLQGATEVPIDTSLGWEYSLNSGLSWYPIAINNYIEMPTLTDRVLFRAKFTAREFMSPVVALDSMILVGTLNATSNEYISRNIQLDRPFTSVKQVLDINAPTGTGVNIYYCTDVSGMQWHSATMTETKVLDASGYKRYTFEDTVSGLNVTNYRVRITLVTNNPCVRPRVKNLMSILK